MFIKNGLKSNYNTKDLDVSLHSGIPRQYYHLKDKDFSDWEISPCELFIFNDRLLGEGSFSKVYLAKWRETFVVAKIIKEEIIIDKKNLIMREIDIMTKLHHPNIVQFLGYVDNPFILVMEYIPKDNLEVNIKYLSLNNKLSIMNDVLKGLAYLHNRRPYSLIHRDIKPRNILLTNSKVAKITDFGLSKFNEINDVKKSYDNLVELSDDNMTSNVGTERYMAPEMSESEIINYTNKIDIYSCGIMFYEMFENKNLYKEDSIRYYHTPKNIRTLIDNMISTHANERYTALRLLEILNYEL